MNALRLRLAWTLPHRVAAAGLIAMCAVGCRAPSSIQATGPTQSDRLMQAYPTLQSGRFLVIADFEDAAQMELFQLTDASSRAECTLDGRGGRVATGRGSLRFTAGSSDDAIVVSNRRAEHWYLKRDWRPYDLFLMSVHVPKGKSRAASQALSLNVAIAAGVGADRPAVEASLALQPGWNVLRLDLADVGERIPLDDVRELRFSVVGAAGSVQLHFDDILLTGFRQDLFGDSGNSDGSLYVQRIGQRWRIGAGGGFELTFANGQIVAWHNLTSDPYRLTNLAEGTVLGPSPLVLGPPELKEAGFSALGSAVVVREEILEANAVRAVVSCTWWFIDDPQLPTDDRPFQRWIYTIYRSGQVYVAARHTAATESWAPRLGLAVTTRLTPDSRRVIHSGEDGETNPEDEVPCYATARWPQADAFLLFAPAGLRPSVRMSELVDEERRRASLVLAAPPAGLPVLDWVAHVLLGQSRDVSDEEASQRAAAYANAPPLKLELGTAAPVGIDTSIESGFDAAEGCYVIAPDHGRVRFVIGSADRPLFSPAFRILDSANRTAWVYVDHLLSGNHARDAAGNLLFQLPGVRSEPTVVEVLLERR